MPLTDHVEQYLNMKSILRGYRTRMNERIQICMKERHILHRRDRLRLHMREIIVSYVIISDM